jgi:hypothetical protein
MDNSPYDEDYRDLWDTETIQSPKPAPQEPTPEPPAVPQRLIPNARNR